ncbi:MAG: pseudouridine synthase [Saprospiraceae bacterium]|nr:pseudouridine synthase [Saprospiraceae bacterium]
MSKHYYIVHKPYGYLSQFTKEQDSDLTLKDLVKVEKDVYPVGRLDKDSEGILLLTNDKRLNFRLLDPSNHIQKTYWVQIEGVISNDAIQSLTSGVVILINKKEFRTAPARLKLLLHPNIEDRSPPIRFRNQIPTSWVQIIIHEGKNRQIRKMFSKVGYPVLRLIRMGIGKYLINEFVPGKFYKIMIEEIIK